MDTLFDLTYDRQIEHQFADLQANYEQTVHHGTSKEDVLQFLLDHPEKVWFWSWEFVGQLTSKGGYLSHRAPARASDLALHNQTLVEDRRIGRFKVYRLRRENLDQVLKFLQ